MDLDENIKEITISCDEYKKLKEEKKVNITLSCGFSIGRIPELYGNRMTTQNKSSYLTSSNVTIDYDLRRSIENYLDKETDIIIKTTEDFIKDSENKLTESFLDEIKNFNNLPWWKKIFYTFKI